MQVGGRERQELRLLWQQRVADASDGQCEKWHRAGHRVHQALVERLRCLARLICYRLHGTKEPLHWWRGRWHHLGNWHIFGRLWCGTGTILALGSPGTSLGSQGFSWRHSGFWWCHCSCDRRFCGIRLGSLRGYPALKLAAGDHLARFHVHVAARAALEQFELGVFLGPHTHPITFPPHRGV